MLKLEPMNTVDFQTFVNTFNTSYSDYFVPLQIHSDAMHNLIIRDAIDERHSTVAYWGDNAVGVGMLAVRNQISWIGGIGVVPDYRRRGIARAIMDHMIDAARSLSLSVVELEVLMQNEGAFKLYQSLGFDVQQELHILNRDKTVLPIQVDSQWAVKDIDTKDALKEFDTLHTRRNPWQRDLAALQNLANGLSGWGVYDQDNKLSAYAIGWPTDTVVRFMDVAGEPDMVLAILEHVHQTYANVSGSYVNIFDDDPLLPLFHEHGYTTVHKQYAMTLTL